MARPRGQLRLGAFFNPTGHHVASWRHPGAQADAGINFKHYVEIAQTAERAKFDMVFLADNVCVREANMQALSRSAQYIANFEPITLISALAAVTERIGLTHETTPEGVERDLCAALPPSDWTRMSDALILHGRRLCRPRPLCGSSPPT